MHVTSVEGFSAQLQNTTNRSQKFGLFYQKFSAEFNDITLNI